MAAINGVVVRGTVVPGDTTDTYAATDPQYGIDGLRSVPDTATRNAISEPRRRQGMLVVVQEDLGSGPNSIWQLQAPPWNDDDADWIQFTGGSATSPGVSATSYNTEQWSWTNGTDASGGSQIGIGSAAKDQKRGPEQWAAATTINLNIMSSDGRDMTRSFDWLFIPGNEIYIQEKTDSRCFGRYRITGPVTNQGTWYQCPVTLVDSSLLPPIDATPVTVTIVQYSGVGLTTVAPGDLIFGSAVDTWSNFPKGTSNQILMMDTNGNFPVWGDMIDGGTW
jgi:hypothetical protein